MGGSVLEGNLHSRHITCANHTPELKREGREEADGQPALSTCSESIPYPTTCSLSLSLSLSLSPTLSRKATTTSFVSDLIQELESLPSSKMWGYKNLPIMLPKHTQALKEHSSSFLQEAPGHPLHACSGGSQGSARRNGTWSMELAQRTACVENWLKSKILLDEDICHTSFWSAWCTMSHKKENGFKII